VRVRVHCVPPTCKSSEERYADDRTRVITPGFPEGYYLNANWVMKCFSGKWHIATRAPLPVTTFLNPVAPAQGLTGGETVPFQTPWMIVQLTQNVERRGTTASSYFPAEAVRPRRGHCSPNRAIVPACRLLSLSTRLPGKKTAGSTRPYGLRM